MRKILILPLMAVLILASCGGKKQEEEKANIPEFTEIAEGVKTAGDGHNAQNSLDTDGVYVGLIADESGKVSADTTIVELTGKLFKKTVKAKNTVKESSEGTIGWSEDGSTITLIGAGASNKYFVGENKLIQLNAQGNKPVGEDAKKYTLTKK